MTAIATAKTWERVPIKKVYLGMYDGPHATPKPAFDGPIFLGIKNITEDGSLNLSEIRHIAEEDYSQWTRRVEPKAGDIVFSYEATLNLYAIIPDGFRGCLGRRLALIRPNPSEINTKFLFYYFFSEDWRQTISKNIVTGATVNRIPLVRFPEFEITRPPLGVQNKIAAVLSAYDDLIKNNQRRIRLLEEIVTTFYQEWFVHFRFPGHEFVAMVDSEIGKIPKGWISKYSDYVDFLEGPGLRNWQYRSEGIPFLNIRTLVHNDIDFSNVQFLDEEEVAQRYSHFLLQPYDHVVSSSGTIGRIVTIQRHHLPLMLNTSIIRMRPKTKAVSKWQLKHFLQSEYFQGQIRAHATGAAQVNYGPSHLKQMWILAPDETIGQRYEDLVSPIEELICQLVSKNANLSQTRDLLLPKLISGDLDVEHLDINTEALDE